MPNAVWDITSKCNLRCKHCYNAEKYFKNSVNDLSYDDTMKLLKFLKDNNCKKLNFLGGEPFASPYIKEILMECKNYNIDVSITTNGTLIDEQMVNFLFNKTSVKNILVSIDGYNAQTNDAIRGNGSFDKSVNALKLLLSKDNEIHKIGVEISYCINNLNCNSSYKMVDLCKEIGLTNLLVTPLIDSGNASLNMGELDRDSFTVLDNIENIIMYAARNYPSLVVMVETRPLVIWYLLKRSFLNVSYSLAHTKCQIHDKLLYIQADGTMHPCGFYSFEAGKIAQQKGYFNSKDTFRFDKYNIADEIYKSKYYTDFIGSMNKLYKPNFHDFCPKCPVRQDCYPCPYQFQDGVAECNWAVNKIKTLQEKLESRMIIDKKIQESKYLSEQENLVLSCCETDRNLKQIYEKYITKAKSNDDFYGFIDIVNLLERKLILKTKGEI